MVRRGRHRSFFRSQEGATTTEFVILAPLFLLMLFAIIEIAMISLSRTTVRANMAEVGRDVRTGLAQCITEQELAERVCRKTLFANCVENVEISQSILGGARSRNARNVAAADAGDVVLMNASYPWPVLTPILTPLLGDQNGEMTLSSSFIFKNEPFNDQIC